MFRFFDDDYYGVSCRSVCGMDEKQWSIKCGWCQGKLAIGQDVVDLALALLLLLIKDDDW